MLKKLLLALMLLLIINCDRYEYVDKNTRFNKLSGNLEKLQYDGSWLSDEQNSIPNNEWNNIIIDYW